MIQTLDEPISVILASDGKTRAVRPTSLLWTGRTYPVLKVGLHHSYKQGDNRYHVFSVVSSGLFFRLLFDTNSLLWRLQEVSDGLPG